jgi:hypothetical protein
VFKAIEHWRRTASDWTLVFWKIFPEKGYLYWDLKSGWELQKQMGGATGHLGRREEMKNVEAHSVFMCLCWCGGVWLCVEENSRHE